MKTIFNRLFGEIKAVEKQIIDESEKLNELKCREIELCYASKIARLIDFFSQNNFQTIIDCKYEQEISNRITIANYSINLECLSFSAKKYAPFVIYGNPSWKEQDVIDNYDFLKSFERDQKTIEYFGENVLEGFSYEELIHVLKNNQEKPYFIELLEYSRGAKNETKITKREFCFQH